jgi:hypothetical protein
MEVQRGIGMEGSAMKARHTARKDTAPARSAKPDVNPYWVDDVTFTLEELRRFRAEH